MNDFKLGLLALSMASITMNAQSNSIQYPKAPADGTTYECFGLTVNDNFRPLENDTASVTTEWVNAENAITNNYLSQISFRENIRKRLKDLYDYKKLGMPWKENDGLYYFYSNDGLQNQSIIYRGKTPYAKDSEVFIDPNKLSDDGTVALTGMFQSKDGRYTAYTISRNGSDWTEIYVMVTATKELLKDHIVWAKFTEASWDGEGFYYSAYARPEAGKEFSNANENHKIYYHRLGTPQEMDAVVYENSAQPLYFHTAGVTPNGQYLVIMGSGQGFGNSLYIKDLKNPNSQLITIEESQEKILYIIDTTADGRLLAYTSIDAPLYRLVAIDPKNPDQKNWEDIIPEKKDAVLIKTDIANGKIIATYDKDASHHAYLYENDGALIGEIPFPTYGSASFSTNRKSEDVYYSFSSFTYPSSVYKLNLENLESTPIKSTKVDGLKSSDYITEQIFFNSKDGTKVPMFIVYKKSVKRNGSNPVYLYGYGGFNISLNPAFSPARLLWLENGGIYAQVNLRGGSEYGETWHEAGTKLNKQNVFDDFISAAEFMIADGWTKSDLITIEGGSNGGLLVGACVNQRPDLFRVAIPRVGVMDMMRYHLFTIGWNWASDYGTADDSFEMAQYLLNYSPIHNVRNDGTIYPAIMVTTADHDDRVVPAHSFKYAATLQASDTGNQPKLIRIDSNAGHGAGKPIAKVINEWTDIYSFIFHNLGITPKK